jgi:hypothetical protein
VDIFDRQVLKAWGLVTCMGSFCIRLYVANSSKFISVSEETIMLSSAFLTRFHQAAVLYLKGAHRHASGIRGAVATYANSVTCSSKLSYVGLG